MVPRTLRRPADGMLASGIRRLHAAYIALVMATGIASVACRLLGLEPAARVLALPFPMPIPGLFLWIALLAWALTFLGLARQLTRTFAMRRDATA